jgi:branched-chain amino acid transport system ATP-binding protein
MSRLIASDGKIKFKGQDITAVPTHRLAKLGIIMVQEGRGLFGEMTVQENLLLGAYGLGGSKDEVERRFEQVFRLFPKLRERAGQVAASMSGGEQQMLAVGRALMAGPKLLMLDEPSLGLAPMVAAGILDTLGELNRGGLGILLVEQKAPQALKLARRVYILSSGYLRAELPAQDIKSHHDLARYYFH